MEYFKRTFQNSYEIKGLFQDTTYYLIQEYHKCLSELDRATGEQLTKLYNRIELIEETLMKMGFEKYNPLETKEV